MNFFKIKNNNKEVFFSSDKELFSTEAVKDYALETGLITNDSGNWEVYLIPSSEYCEHLVDKIYNTFSNELENIKQSWIGKSPDEICSMSYMATNISDVMNALDNADASSFDFEVLENWLKVPKRMVDVICNLITERDSSDYNETICSYFNQGMVV